MPQATPSIVVSASAFDSLPISIERQSSRISALVVLALVVAGLCVAVVPATLLLVFAARNVWEAMHSQPVAVGALAAGLLIWAALFLVPAWHVIQCGWNSRHVRITTDRVSVSDKGLFGSRLWTAPLSEFRGIAHHVRASLSGVRHELILVHRVSGRSLLLHAADSISQPTIDRAAALLRLPQISAHELYRVTRRSSSMLVIDRPTEAQAA